MHHVVAPAPVHQHIVLVAREPGVEPVDQPVERRPRDQLAVLRAENSDRRLAAGDDVEHVVAEQRLEHAVADAEHHQIVFVARLIEGAEGQMMHLGLARQQRIDHVAAEPVAEVADVAVGHHRDAAGGDRHQPLGRREPHQHLPGVDRRGAFDAEAVAVEQQRQIVEAEVHWPSRARRGRRSPGEIGRAIAQHHVLLAEAQMGEEALDVGDLFERAEHDDDVGIGGGLGRKVAGVEIAATCCRGDDRSPDSCSRSAANACSVIAAAEIEHARAGRDELGGEFRPRVGRECDARRDVGRGFAARDCD